MIVLDSATLYYRSYFALPESMTAPDGHPNNAVRGFLQTLTRLMTRFQPRAVVAAWDTDWRPEWRVRLLPSYKTHRLATEEDDSEVVPDTLGPQIGAISEILTAWGLPVIGAPGAEADDIIGTLARHHEPMVVVSSDRDLLQVVTQSVTLFQMAPGGMEKWSLLDPHRVREKYGIDPQRYVDFAVLRGDPSDGLPGVRGIGEKTAATLIQAFESLEGLVAAARSGSARPLTPRMASIILDSLDYIEAAREVVAVRTDCEVPSVVAPLPNSPEDPGTLESLSREWGVERYVKEAIAAAQTARA